MPPQQYSLPFILTSASVGLIPSASRPLRSCLRYHNVNLSYRAPSSNNRTQGTQPTQAQPLSGYYADLLSASSSELAQQPSAPSQNKEERARVVFGSRLAGSGYERQTSSTPDSTWEVINGVPVPPRPAEPDNCCMSGCVHCVWDDYRDEIENWAGRVQKAQAMVGSAGVVQGELRVSEKLGARRSEVLGVSSSMDEDGGGSETSWDVRNSSELFAGIPVGIREFMRTEKRLRERHRETQKR